MRKSIISIIALISVMNLFAQGNTDIIYKEHDTSFNYCYDGDMRYYDINDDSIPDILFETFSEDYHLAFWFGTQNGWKCCGYSHEEYPSTPHVFRDLSIPLNDSLLIWGVKIPSVYYVNHCDTLSYKAGLRYFDGQNYYYGWMEAYNFGNIWGPFWAIKIVRTCYCTIPDYPLHWGQTSLDWTVVETASSAFADIYPNPTKNTFTVTGKDLKQAEVLNMLGQRVATATGQGETLHIDIANLPTGVYFVRITDEEGRKCVQKVVKE